MDTNEIRTRETVGQLLAEASRSFFLPNDLEKTLGGVTRSAVGLIDGADCADILMIDGRKGFKSHASTSDLPIRLDELQEELQEGPCVDAARRDIVVRSDNLKADERWPRFGPAAVDAGVHSTLSFQLYTDDGAVGALNVFGKAPDAFSDEDEEIGTMLATHAAIALYTAGKAEQFRSALASRDVIGQAKGMIMERYDIDAVRAFELLSKLSQDVNLSVADLARDIVERGSEKPGH
ncbi:MAG: GAF and ANTAR domain-containing protein [Rhodococcus sp. (in: high G+C Gram-positive bacteria)]